jgi:hypothetical protein
MMHDGMGDDTLDDGGGEGCGGEDDGEDNEEEEEEDFLDDLLRHVETELLMKTTKGLNNFETVKKARKEPLYEESKSCEKRWLLLRFVLDMLILKAKYG